MSDVRQHLFNRGFCVFAMGVLLCLTLAEPGNAQVPEMSGTWIASEPSPNVEASRNGDLQRRAPGGETVIAVTGESVSMTRGQISRTYVVDGQLHIVDGREVRASWDGNLLVLETPRGTETWELKDESELTITRRIGDSIRTRVLQRL